MKSRKSVIPIKLCLIVFLALVIVGVRDHLKRINQLEEQSQYTDRSADPRFNAAVCYLQAIDQLKYPSDKESKQRLNDIVDCGWDPENAEVHSVLQDNKRCLDSIHKASNLTRCDFSYNKPYKYLVDKAEFPCSDMQKLGKLLLLNARYYEYYKNEHFIEACLNTLTFAYHLSLDKSHFGILVSFLTEQDAYSLILDHAESGISFSELSVLHKYLSHHQKRHIPAQALVFYERDFFISNMQLAADAMVAQAAEQETEFNQKQITDVAQAFMRQVKQSANKYYGYFAKAAMTNKAEDLAKAKNAMEDLRKSVEPDFVRELADLGDSLYRPLVNDRGQYNKAYAKRIVLYIIAQALPDFTVGSQVYHRIYRELEELLALVQRDLNKAKALG